MKFNVLVIIELEVFFGYLDRLVFVIEIVFNSFFCYQVKGNFVRFLDSRGLIFLGLYRGLFFQVYSFDESRLSGIVLALGKYLKYFSCYVFRSLGSRLFDQGRWKFIILGMLVDFLK